jgi:HEAT repeat protein
MKMAEALGRLRTKDAVQPLSAMLDEPELPAREEYIRALVRIGSRGAIPALLKGASQGGWELRQPAIAAAAMLGDQRESASLEKLLREEPALTQAECKKNPDATGCENPGQLARERSSALQSYLAVLEAAKSCQSDHLCWARTLDHSDARVRERAAYEVGRSGKAELAEALAKRLKESNLDVRLALIQSLDWLIADSKEAARKAAASLPNIEQQLAQEKGKTDFAKVNEDLKRLAAALRRQRA